MDSMAGVGTWETNMLAASVGNRPHILQFKTTSRSEKVVPDPPTLVGLRKMRGIVRLLLPNQMTRCRLSDREDVTSTQAAHWRQPPGYSPGGAEPVLVEKDFWRKSLGQRFQKGQPLGRAIRLGSTTCSNCLSSIQPVSRAACFNVTPSFNALWAILEALS